MFRQGSDAQNSAAAKLAPPAHNHGDGRKCEGGICAFNIEDTLPRPPLASHEMKTFCCCLPTRLGVLLLSPLTLCFAAACSTISLYALFRYLDDLALSQRICLAVIGFSTAFLALTSLFGFIGAIVAKRQCVSVYNLSLWIVIFVVTSFGMINFAVQWHLQERFIHACKQDNQNRSNKQCRAVSVAC